MTNRPMRNRKGVFLKGHKRIGGIPKGGSLKASTRKLISKSLVGNKRRWKGDNASYEAKHMWISKHYGKAACCQNELCAFKKPHHYEWANISKKHKRDVMDYFQLCPSCHQKWDLKITAIKVHGVIYE